MSEKTPTPASLPAFVYAERRDWPGYFAAMAGKPPRETLLDALARFEGQTPADAIDLGSGEGRDTEELLRRGWRVLAIDSSPEGMQILEHRPGLVGRERLTTRVAAFEDLGELPKVMLLNASFSLPFCHPDHFEGLWGSITRAILPGGRFAGQLFGDRDSWASIPDRTHHSRGEVEGLLAGFDVETLTENESDAVDHQGRPKHWHMFHIVARKRG